MAVYCIVEYNDINQVNGIWSADSTNVKLNDKIEILADSNPSDIYGHLKATGYLATRDKRKLEITDMDKDIIEIKQKSDKRPLIRLERIFH